MGELSVTPPTSDDEINFSEETDIDDKTKEEGPKKDVTKKTVKFQIPDPTNPSNYQKYQTRIFVSTQRKHFNKLNILKNELYETIASTEGLWFTDLVGLYFDRFGEYPDIGQFRIINLVDVIRCMPDRVKMTPVKKAQNVWLSDASNPHPPPENEEAESQMEPEPKPEQEPENVSWWDPCPPEPPDTSEKDEEALPGIPYAPCVFPIDCIQPGETIPNMELPELHEDYLDIEVFITSSYSPSHIWLRITDNMNDAIEAMIDEMLEYYENGEGSGRRLAYAAMKVGLYCAVKHDVWHRALIVRRIDLVNVKVLLVDQGTVLSVNVGSMKPLRREWMTLPAQAVRARMVGVRPPDGAQLWPRFSCSRFREQTRGLPLIARILYVDRYERVLYVYLSSQPTKQRIQRKLVITEGEDHGTELIKAKYAEPEPNSSIETGEMFSYFFPLFDVLEAGATPSYEELEALAKRGFEPEDVPSFVGHVPPLEPIRCITPPHLTEDIQEFGPLDAASSMDQAIPVAATSSLNLSLDTLTLGAVATSSSGVSDPMTGAIKKNPFTGANRKGPVSSKPVTGAIKKDPFIGANRKGPVSSKPMTGTIKKDPFTGAIKKDPFTGAIKKDSMSLEPVTGAMKKDPMSSEPVMGSMKKDPMSSEPVMGSIKMEPVIGAIKKDPVSSEPLTGAIKKEPVSSEPVIGAIKKDPVSSEPETGDIKDSVSSEPVTSVIKEDPMSSKPVTGAIKKDPVSSEPVTGAVGKDPSTGAIRKDPGSSEPVTGAKKKGAIKKGTVSSKPATSNPGTPASVYVIIRGKRRRRPCNVVAAATAAAAAAAAAAAEAAEAKKK